MRYWVLIAVLLAAAAFARVWNLDAVGLNTDELFVARTAFVDGDWVPRGDIHPPLYNALTRALGLALPGSVEMQTRAASALAGSALVGALAAVGAAAAGPSGAVVAAVTAIFDPTRVAESRLARSYALFGLLQAIGFALLWEIVRVPTCRKRRYGLALVNAASLYTFYYAAYFIAAQVVVALAARPRAKTVSRSILIAAGAGAAAFAPWLIVLARQAARFSESSGWTHWSGGLYQWARRAILIFTHASPAEAMSRAAYFGSAHWGAAVAVIATAAVVVLAWRRSARSGADLFGLALQDAGGGMGAGLPIVVIAVVFGLAMTAHAILGAPIGYAYFAGLAAPVWALFVMALDALPGRWPRAVAVGCVVAAQLVVLPSAIRENREDLREAVRTVDHLAAPGARALCVAHFVKDAFEVYSTPDVEALALPDDLPGFGPLPREAAAVMPESARAAFLRAVPGPKEVWLLESHGSRDGVDRGAILSRLWLTQAGYRMAGRFEWRGVAAERYWSTAIFAPPL